LEISVENQQWTILACALFGILFGLYNAWRVMSIEIVPAGKANALEGEQDDERTDIRANENGSGEEKELALLREMADIATLIQDGSTTFLKEEYTYTGVFIIIFAIGIYFTVEPEAGTFHTTVPFLLGAATSILSGYIGMQIAVRANVRTAKEACHSMDRAFNVAFRGGIVLGFTLVGLALLVLLLLIVYYQNRVFT